jgi:hypothetical protein
MKRKRPQLSKKQKAAKRAQQAEVLTADEKKALLQQLLNMLLVVLMIDQPWMSSVFKPKTETSSPKDMEFRNWGLDKIGVDKTAPKFCLLLSTMSCVKHRGLQDQYRTGTSCYSIKSKNAAAKAGDDALIVPLACNKMWVDAIAVIEKNGYNTGAGYPFNTIEGLVLFEGEADLKECEAHPWWPGHPEYGSRGLRIKKTIRFPNPIHNVRGFVQGTPKRVATSCWLEKDTVECETEEQKLARGSGLLKEIKKQLTLYM